MSRNYTQQLDVRRTEKRRAFRIANSRRQIRWGSLKNEATPFDFPVTAMGLTKLTPKGEFCFF